MRSLNEKSLQLLNKKLKEKQEQSPNFTLRAFARFLKVSPTTLSEGLKGHRGLATEVIRLMCSKLQLNALEQAEILANNPVDFEFLDEESFELISDWEFLAVLNLVQIKGFSENPEWIASRLGIEVDRARYVFERLHTLGYLHKVDGVWTRIEKKLHNGPSVPRRIINKCLEQDLELVRRSIYSGTPDKSDSSGITFVLTEDGYREAQILIRKLRLDLAALSTSSISRGVDGEVYKFNTHLYPLTAKKS